MMRLLLIATGGALGALARYALAGFVHRFTSALFPYGTFAVNVVGCLCFGVILGLAEQRFVVGPAGRSFLLIGLLGGFTTFSSYTFETFELLRDAEYLRAAINAAGQVVAGLLALWAGYSSARMIW
jgi:CrcB protein